MIVPNISATESGIDIIPRFRYETKLSLQSDHKMRDLANAQVFINKYKYEIKLLHNRF